MVLAVYLRFIQEEYFIADIIRFKIHTRNVLFTSLNKLNILAIALVVRLNCDL